MLIRGFSIKLSVRKLWREKANMQISSYKSVQPVHRGRFSSLLGRVILMFPIVDRRYGSTLLALYGSGSVQRSIGLPYGTPFVTKKGTLIIPHNNVIIRDYKLAYNPGF